MSKETIDKFISWAFPERSDYQKNIIRTILKLYEIGKDIGNNREAQLPKCYIGTNPSCVFVDEFVVESEGE